MTEEEEPFKITVVHIGKDDLPSEAFTHKYERDQDHPEPTTGKVTINISSRIEKELGMAGRMISMSKSHYLEDNPDHTVYFNACIFDEEGKEIWFGDLDLTKEEDKLNALAESIGQTIYVTSEKPFRFDGFDPDTLDKLPHYERERVKKYPNG